MKITLDLSRLVQDGKLSAADAGTVLLGGLIMPAIAVALGMFNRRAEGAG
jgi:hypothetical protein